MEMHSLIILTMKQVLVFKTSVHSLVEISAVEHLLNKLLTKTEKWSFDLEDCDRVLRIEAESVQANCVIENLTRAGVLCSELE